jgi:hypothetical protein
VALQGWDCVQFLCRRAIEVDQSHRFGMPHQA